ncbi:MAG TPA: response regulator transcription factor [Bacteroidota bacterium]|nr:response regulator transcription factor [Bacteroidota bacterium]
MSTYITPMEAKRNDDIIKVAIVDDDEDIRNGLRWMLEYSEGYSCTGVYKSCADAREHIGANLPDVVLMDIGLPEQNGIECVRILKAMYPDIQIVMQTVYSDDEKIFESLRAGAVGYILKKSQTVKVLQAISDAHAGGAPMSGEIARRVLNFFSQPQPVDEIGTLSDREIEVLEALVEGHSYKAIAEKLFVSVHTVRFHLHNIYEKLHVTSRAEAVAKVMLRRGSSPSLGG